MSIKNLSAVRILNLLGHPAWRQIENESNLEDGISWLDESKTMTPAEIIDASGFGASQDFTVTLIFVAALTVGVQESEGEAKFSHICKRAEWLAHLKELLTPANFARLMAAPSPTMVRRAALRAQLLLSEQNDKRSGKQVPDPLSESVQRREALRATSERDERNDLDSEPRAVETRKKDRLSAPILLGQPAPAATAESAKVLFAYDVLVKPLRRIQSPDPNKIRELLSLEFPWLSELIDGVARDLSISERLNQTHFYTPPILLVGPSGVGKTAIAMAIARAVGTPGHLFDAARAAAGEHFGGLGRRFHNAAPSFIVQQILSTKVGNPVLLVEEIDKSASREHGGDGTLEALLGLLDPSTARRWRDPYLEQYCDLSAVSSILTANDSASLPTALVSRVKIYHLPRPVGRHLDSIVAVAVKEMFGAEPSALEPPTLDAQVRKALCEDLDRYGDLRRVRRALRAAFGAVPPPTLH